MIDVDNDLTWIRQTQAERAAAWAEDAELLQRCLVTLELQAMRIEELNKGLGLARNLIEAQRKMLATLRAQLVRVDPAPGPGEPGGEGGHGSRDGGAE